MGAPSRWNFSGLALGLTNLELDMFAFRALLSIGRSLGDALGNPVEFLRSLRVGG